VDWGLRRRFALIVKTGETGFEAENTCGEFWGLSV
jgi:hypothetical protein